MSETITTEPILGMKNIMNERKIVEYMTIGGGNSDIDDKVNEYIIQGWQPFGGISVNLDDLGDSALYVQTMVKYAD